MRIAYIAAGAGGMYCGSCIRDNALVAELQRRGHDALLMPIYTPLRTDETSVAHERVFYGAVNVYLQQLVPVLGRMPVRMRRWLDNPRLLEWVGSSSSTIDAHKLGALTLSMLEGESGRQHAELESLVGWLRDELRPDVVHLTNSMLLGFARRLRRELPDALLVCSVQGEDIFLDDLPEPWRARVLTTMRERAGGVDRFVATARFYADEMAALLDIPAERMKIARLGINLEGFGTRPGEPEEGPLAIGYLARICPEKGLHLLLEAFREVVRDREPGSVVLRVAGYLGGRDRGYHEGLREQAREWGLDGAIEWHGEVDRARKIAFLDSLHVFSVPTVYREPKGLSVLEAMACGVPSVQPAHGAFPELLEATGGGILVEPESALAVAEGLRSLLDDAERRRELGQQGAEGVRARYAVAAMAEETLAAYA
ncbi:MAG TPA: glycosyltransferase family 4 protein [Thermoanaerobaculia bacterium]|nr:glycosyltransferase family 4 protein [Thermoanaerobaculia bacterium]